MSAKLTIGFLGAGKMASALARGFIGAGLVTARQVTASDPSAAARATFSKEVGAKITSSNLDVVRFATVLVLAVKPHQVVGVLAEIRDHLTGKHCLISIAAGVSLAKLEAGLGAAARLIRVMPNTPALVGTGATAFALGKSARPADGELAQRLFSSVGVAYE
ncbi:MAG: NAD(P)-binding domain-containing protein, partial [Verrucomicrobia bacterium]|nr:NAD(P)-binding domain-containing protein [Verrucomicrobiota bacterium]